MFVCILYVNTIKSLQLKSHSIPKYVCTFLKHIYVIIQMRISGEKNLNTPLLISLKLC